MNEPVLQPSPDPHHRAGHETTDASPLYIGLFALGVGLMVALVLPLLSWIFWRFEAAAQRADPAQSPLAGSQSPPAPRLEEQPAAELASLRHAEDQRLSSYGWIDPQQRVVRVPIDRAIEILAERGLPEPQELPKQEPPKQGPPKSRCVLNSHRPRPPPRPRNRRRGRRRGRRRERAIATWN